MAGAEPAEQGGEEADHAAEEHRGPHVKMRAADVAFPRERRDPQRERDAEQPLERHQAGEQAIGAAVDVVLIGREQLAGAARDGFGRRRRQDSQHERAYDLADANSEHPNTLVDA